MNSNCHFKKGFTIIELLTVVAILGILVLIATPKFLGHSEKAVAASIKADLKIVQTAVDSKATEKGELSLYDLKVGDAKKLDIETLQPEHLGKVHQRDGYEFWIDSSNTVYYNGIYPPENVKHNETTLSWDSVEHADEYNVYKIEDKKEITFLDLVGIRTVFADNLEKNKKFYKSTKDLSMEVPKGVYLVSSVGRKTESVAVGTEYKGPDTSAGGTPEGETPEENPGPVMPDELKELEKNGETIIRIDSEGFTGVQQGETKATDSLTKAIELSSSGNGLFLNNGDYKPQSNDVFWDAPYKKYSALILRKSLILSGESTEKTILTIDDLNTIKKSDGQFFAITTNAPDITLKNMTIHIKQENVQYMDAVFNIWGGWDGTTSRNLTLENVTVIVDSPVKYLFYMNDYNVNVKNMKVISNGNLESMFYWNFGNISFTDSSFDIPNGGGNVTHTNTTFK